MIGGPSCADLVIAGHSNRWIAKPPIVFERQTWRRSGKAERKQLKPTSSTRRRRRHREVRGDRQRLYCLDSRAGQCETHWGTTAVTSSSCFGDVSSDAPEARCSARTSEAGDISVPNRIRRIGQDDRNGGRRILQGANCGRRAGDEDIHFEANQLRRRHGNRSYLPPAKRAKMKSRPEAWPSSRYLAGMHHNWGRSARAFTAEA